MGAPAILVSGDGGSVVVIDFAAWRPAVGREDTPLPPFRVVTT
jgi:hypothetical protein